MLQERKIASYSFLASIIIHALILFGPFLGSKDATPNKEPPKPKKQQIRVILHKEFIPKEEKKKVIKRKTVKIARKKVPKPQNKSLKCKDGRRYIGVGFTHRGLGIGYDEVIEVAPGYAADRAGLQVGDVVIGIIDLNIGYDLQPLYRLKNGKKGTPVTLVIERMGIRMEIDMVREEVCTKK